ncbi:MAG: N-acetyltransferase, partial [Bacteroidales bacterium]|nr:N-acetyltransferase [Candidatus Colimorpha onthohippi]
DEPSFLPNFEHAQYVVYLVRIACSHAKNSIRSIPITVSVVRCGFLRDDYLIRLEKPQEEFIVENLIREAFWNVYRPGCLEHYVMHCLRNDSDFIPQLNFVMEIESQRFRHDKEENRLLKNELIGQAMCMRAHIQKDDGTTLPIMTLGPIGILPDYQRQGYGKALLDYTLAKATEMGFGAVCFEGNIDFYGKSGFTYASNFGIRYHGLPEGEDSSFFLCKELREGYLQNITGEYTTPQGYFVNEAEAEAFDKQFAPKEKRRQPGQLW